MLLKYWKYRRLTQAGGTCELASMGVSQAPVIKVINEILTGAGQALISVYLFSRYSEAPGSLVVCHDVGRGAISFGATTLWGQWDEAAEILTIDGTGEQFDFDGTLLGEGGDGSCSLGNI